MTTDVDFVVVVDSVEHLKTLVRRLQPSGFLPADPKPMVFRRAWVGRLLLDAQEATQPVVVDLVRPVGRGVEGWLTSVFERATEVAFEGGGVPIVAPEDLVLLKLLVQEDRGYDLDDARSVVDGVAALDRRYLVRTALKLGIRAKLRHLGI